MTPEAAIIETLFKVVNKEGKDIPFELNQPQCLLDNALTKRNIIPKARQEGISTYFLARYTAAALMRRNVKAVIISHDTESTQRLLTRCEYFLENLRCDERPEIGRSALNTITLPKMDSVIYIGTAGSKKFGRGDTITHLHCSEYAYWPDPKGLLSGLLQAVPLSGEISIESTGNGKGNDYHRRCMRAYNNQSVWKCHFFNWVDFPEYTLNLTLEDQLSVMSGLIEEWEEPHLVKTVGLTAGQIAWRRLKLEELDYDLDLFKQEYPLTIDECFRASGSSLFRKVNFIKSDLWKNIGNHAFQLEGHPRLGFTYSLGADPAGGSGGDNATIQIFCVETGEQVYEYANNRIEPDAFGRKVVEVGTQFNFAFLTIESNNHGPVTIKEVRDLGYPDFLLYEMSHPGADFPEDRTLMQFGFRTTKRTKPILIGEFRTSVIKDLKIYSSLLYDEMTTFIEHENGELSAQENCHDDRVMGAALANIALSKASLYARNNSTVYTKQDGVYKDPFILDNMIEEMQSRGKKFPISPQHLITRH